MSDFSFSTYLLRSTPMIRLWKCTMNPESLIVENNSLKAENYIKSQTFLSPSNPVRLLTFVKLMNHLTVGISTWLKCFQWTHVYPNCLWSISLMCFFPCSGVQRWTAARQRSGSSCASACSREERRSWVCSRRWSCWCSAERWSCTAACRPAKTCLCSAGCCSLGTRPTARAPSCPTTSATWGSAPAWSR